MPDPFADPVLGPDAANLANPGSLGRIGVTGLSGYLGQRLGSAVRAAGYQLVDLGRGSGVDLAEPSTLAAAVSALRPDAIIHAAAANPGRPEASFDASNRAAPAALARTAASLGIRLVHVSTDSVFNGTVFDGTVFHGRAGPYPDGAPVSPINHYGETKAAGEAAVLAAHPGAVSVRTSLIYGLHEPDRGTAEFVRRLRAGQPVRLFVDAIRQPVWVEALSAGLVRLATELASVHGVINLAGSQALDRAAFARRMLRYWGVSEEVLSGPLVADVRASEVSTSVPLDLRLELRRAGELGLDCPGVDEVLARHPR